MIVDSSAIIAILDLEAEAEIFARIIESAESCSLSVANYLESSIVIESRRKEAGRNALNDLIVVAKMKLVPVDRTQAEIAREAARIYGKSNHKAALNFGDCFAYALAKTTGEPLLYKGTDFAQTGIRSAAEKFSGSL